ncbi:MAG: hypothetical protein HQL40_11690 [Alphaproteobacteria bacterium]|nr:hypothetical protein [Alphaproteobacteria bacterium]
MSAEDLKLEMRKTASLVDTARRLVADGKIVDLAALEGKARMIADGAGRLPRDEGRTLLPGLEALVEGLDRLAEELGRARGRVSFADPAET